MDDDERARHERLLKEQTDLQRALERSRERVGVDPEDLHRVAAAALSRAGYVLDDARGAVGRQRGNLPAQSRRSGVHEGRGLGRCLRRSAGSAAQARRATRRLAARCAHSFDRLQAADLGRRPRCLGRRAGASRAPACQAASLSLPQPGLSVETVARIGHLWAGRAAPRRADGPPGGLWRGRRAAARRSHPHHRDLDGIGTRPQAAPTAGRERRGEDPQSARSGAARRAGSVQAQPSPASKLW